MLFRGATRFSIGRQHGTEVMPLQQKHSIFSINLVYLLLEWRSSVHRMMTSLIFSFVCTMAAAQRLPDTVSEELAVLHD